MNASSFILCIGSAAKNGFSSNTVPGSLEASCRRLYPYSNQITSFFDPAFWIGFNGNSDTKAITTTTGGTGIWIFNDNRPSINVRLADTFRESGIEGICDLDTTGVILIKTEGKLYCYNGSLGITPLYFGSDGNNILVSTEMKAIAVQDIVPATIAPVEAFRIDPYFREPGHCPVREFEKIDAGCILEIDLKSTEYRMLPDRERNRYTHTSEKDSVRTLHNMLEDIIRENSHDNAIGIPLSGGFDSGVIAGIANRYTKIKSFTMGTSEMNEFEGARKMSEFIGSEHSEYAIREEELIPAILHGIYLNEFADPVYAEGYSGLYFIFREASASVRTMLTGYGADLSLSNFLKGPLADMEHTADKLIRRTSRTGELNSNVAAHFGLEVVHPFLNRNVIDYILSMPAGYKVKDGVEKHIEKELITAYKLMPPKLLEMKKKALHTGAGIDRLFNQALGIGEDENYIIKSHFLFNVWKELIFNNVDTSNADIDKLVYLTKRTAT